MYPKIKHTDSILLINDYIRFRLKLEDFEWDQCFAANDRNDVWINMQNMCIQREISEGIQLSWF